MTDQDPTEIEDTLPPGTQLGKYQIVRLMGRGGMGAVYEGVHRDLKKRVAIKTLHPTVAALPDARTRFLREGEAASRIRHPNVVDVTDVGMEGGTTYLVMEFLEGEDLAALIERSGALAVAQAADILLPVIGAIAVAHEEGVIHRDLKPGNVFMTRTRHGGFRPTVLDFGISKLSAGGGNTLALTGTGASMGTPYYVAPEQIRSAAGADSRSDQYALGAILYECVTGRRAHQGESIYEVIRSVGEGAFTPPSVLRPDIPPALEAAILRAMQLDPSRRFPSVQAFGRAIMPFASPSVRDHWTPALGGGSSDAPTPPRLAAGPLAGGTVILPTPAPGSAASGSKSTSPSSTTLGASAAQITLPVQRRRLGLLVGGLLVLAGGATALYFVTAPTPHSSSRERNAPAGPSAEDPPVAPEARKPAGHYRVVVTASPGSAHFDLDGRPVGTGRILEELAIDGVEHTLTVAASGFRPAKLTFRDRPPPGEVTLEPIAASAHDTGKPAVGEGRPPSSGPHKQDHEGGHRKPHAKPGGAPSAPNRGASDAPILD